MVFKQIGAAALLATVAWSNFGGMAEAASCNTLPNTQALLAEAATKVEAARRQLGRRGLSRHAALDKAAQDHACWLSRTRGGSLRDPPHRGKGGNTPKTRVKRAGYRSCLTAENIGVNQRSGAAVVQAWLASPGHRANLSRAKLRDYGLGGLAVVEGKPVWVLVLAQPC